jgi:drug/metabolite transporter (DMT)-like permease
VTPFDVIELVLLAAIWGASFLFMRIAAPEFGPVPLIAVRVGVAAAFLLLVLAPTGRARQLRAHAGALVAVGALSAAVPFSLFAYAVLWVTAGLASVLNATVPLFGAVVAYVWLGERLDKLRVAGLVIGFGGVVLLVWDRVSLAGGGSTWAVGAALTASFLYGIAASFTKKFLGTVDPLVSATGSQLASAMLLFLPAVALWPGASPSPQAWISVTLLGILCTAVAVTFYFRLIARIGPARTVTVTYLIPVFGVLWGYVFLDETVSGRMIAGCAVILLGTSLASGALERGA